MGHFLVHLMEVFDSDCLIGRPITIAGNTDYMVVWEVAALKTSHQKCLMCLSILVSDGVSVVVARLMPKGTIGAFDCEPSIHIAFYYIPTLNRRIFLMA